MWNPLKPGPPTCPAGTPPSYQWKILYQLFCTQDNLRTYCGTLTGYVWRVKKRDKRGALSVITIISCLLYDTCGLFSGLSHMQVCHHHAIILGILSFLGWLPRAEKLLIHGRLCRQVCELSQFNFAVASCSSLRKKHFSEQKIERSSRSHWLGSSTCIMPLHVVFLFYRNETEVKGYFPLFPLFYRGKRSLETICLVLAYKIKFPENFFLLRGNHECASINRIYGFYDECNETNHFNLQSNEIN